MLTTCQTLGSHGSRSAGPCEYLTLAFSPLSAPLRARWRNNGLSADFLSDYVTTFLPGGDSALTDIHQTAIRHAVSYVANELLENAMKYHETEIDAPIQIHLELTRDRITISATNGVGAGQARVYRDFVVGLLAEEPGELLVRQMETAANSESDTSSVGLLTMISDYGAELGWRFAMAPEQRDAVTVTTSASLSLENIPGVVK